MTFIGLEVDLKKLKIFNLVLQDMCISGLIIYLPLNYLGVVIKPPPI